MALTRSRITARGQISVPAKVRQRLGVGPGSVLEWDEDADTVVVRKAGRYTFEDVHRSLFARTPKSRTVAEMKQGSGGTSRDAMRTVDTNALVRLAQHDVQILP
jgi:AbrB family looped-hinge helix DNA binding protein